MSVKSWLISDSRRLGSTYVGDRVRSRGGRDARCEITEIRDSRN